MLGASRSEICFGSGGRLIYFTWNDGARRHYPAVREIANELVFEDQYGAYPQRIAFQRTPSASPFSVRVID